MNHRCNFAHEVTESEILGSHFQQTNEGTTNEGTVPYGLREWSLANPDAADLPPPISTWNASRLWPMFDNIDMLTAARVQSIAIKNKTTTLATEYARQGKNWRTELAQFEKEQQFLAKHGLDK